MNFLDATVLTEKDVTLQVGNYSLNCRKTKAKL